MARRVLHRFLPALISPLLFLAAAHPGSAASDRDVTNQITAQDHVVFLRDVRPILSSHCFKCHGPDSKTRKAGLRLDSRDEATRVLKSGDRAIVPGNPAESTLVTRIHATDADDMMPPPAAKLALTPSQMEILKRWVAQGAEYQPHWAFVPPVQPDVPKSSAPIGGSASTARELNPIDAFIRSRLVAEGLEPSPEADRATLLRRLSLDLTGLPPAPEDITAFVADTDPKAYEKRVDQLLASKHYGERWARRWMDLARYADTNGYEKDRPRSIWPWRDWLIRALNDDMPYDQFTSEQLAGDLLPGATMSQRTATGFHRNTMLNEEGGVDPLEFRFHAMVDRVHTTATTWLGMTFACAQCHTHKYDPIEQKEYYQFMAFLDNADEPTVDVPDDEGTRRRAEIEARAAAMEADLPNRFPVPSNQVFVTPSPTRVATDSGAVAVPLPDGSFRFEGTLADQDTYTFELETTESRLTTLNLDALADDALPSKGPGRTPHGNFVLSELRVFAQPLNAGTQTEPVQVPIAGATTDFAQSGFPVDAAYDGRADTGWAISGQGAWNINRRATFRFAQPAGYPSGTRFRIQLVQHHGGKHLLGRVRLSLGSETSDTRPVEERRREYLNRQFGAWQSREVQKVRTWTPLRPTLATSSVPVLEIEADDSVFVRSDQTKSDTYHLRFRSDLKGITALRLEVLPDPRLPRNGPGRVYFEGPIGDFYLSTFSVRSGDSPLKLVQASQTFASGGNTASKALDEDQQTGWSIDGGQGRRHVAVFRLESPLQDASDLQLDMLFERYYPGGLGRFRISATTDPRGGDAVDLADDLQRALLKPAASRTEAETQGLLRAFAAVAPELAAERESIAKLRREAPSFPTTLVFQERPAHNPRITRMRTRGEFLQPGDPVSAGLPSFLARLTDRQPANRLEFARWLTSPSNPLTARVAMNRHWAAFFGRGLVRTTEDFGFQGELPSHPELLDWLAVEFRKRGWSQKAMHKLIVLSATYRQSSRVLPIHLQKDPQNRLLARAPRLRLEGEIVRDLALHASGLLSAKIGGPSVFPPQLANITREGTYGPLDWVVSSGEDRYRRGLYTFAKRTAPYAAFQTFDAPSGEACVARREVSNTPLQSLTLLNDEVFLEASQALGRKAAALAGDDNARVAFLFQRTLSRPPQPDEVSQVLRFFRRQTERLSAGEIPADALAGPGEGSSKERAAWTAVARALLNLDEAITRG